MTVNTDSKLIPLVNSMEILNTTTVLEEGTTFIFGFYIVDLGSFKIHRTNL